MTTVIFIIAIIIIITVIIIIVTIIIIIIIIILIIIIIIIIIIILCRSQKKLRIESTASKLNEYQRLKAFFAYISSQNVLLVCHDNSSMRFTENPIHCSAVL